MSDIFSLMSSGDQTADAAVTGASTAIGAVGYAFPEFGGMFWGTAASVIGNLFARLFGGGEELTHAQREAAEASGLNAAASGFATEIKQAATFQALWDTLVRHQSGYVGGTSSVAISVGAKFPPAEDLPGQQAVARQLVAAGIIRLPSSGVFSDPATFPPGQGGVVVAVGNPNPYYLTFTPGGFFEMLIERPEIFLVSIQGGVSTSFLEGGNRALRAIILLKVKSLYDAGLVARMGALCLEPVHPVSPLVQIIPAVPPTPVGASTVGPEIPPDLAGWGPEYVTAYRAQLAAGVDPSEAYADIRTYGPGGKVAYDQAVEQAAQAQLLSISG